MAKVQEWKDSEWLEMARALRALARDPGAAAFAALILDAQHDAQSAALDSDRGLDYWRGYRDGLRASGTSLRALFEHARALDQNFDR